MLLRETRLRTSQLSSLFTFYGEVLELPVIQPASNHISITAGASQLIFESTGEIENPFYHFAFNIPSNKFEEALQWIQGKLNLLWLNDYQGYIADFKNWHARSFYFTDPGGNILEFVARFDLNDIANESFSTAHIRNVSEIGIVFPIKTFDADVTGLLNHYPLSYFDKQPPLPHFRAVGNDEGLFVIVPENRIWFSTKDTISHIFPMEITFSENGILYQLKI